MSNIIDRRLNTKGKSTNNRNKFLKRVSNKIKKALPDVISDQNMGATGKVKVPIKGIKEPSFRHDPKTGDKKYVRPGNDSFSQGDRVPKPKGGGKGKGGRKGSNDPAISEDDFFVELSREEFLKYFFDDLQLPDMVKKYLESTVEFKTKRAGYVKEGVPAKLNVKESYSQSLARRIAIQGRIKKLLEEHEAKLKALYADEDDNSTEIEKELAEIDRLKKYLKSIPFMDNIDLRYNHSEQYPVPTTSAVMFCIMDVSGSMGRHEKDVAKRFFTLLYLFLTKTYENIDLVFIRHHTVASEVSEQEFFESRETGGTIVAPSLKLMRKIMKERYGNGKWNAYMCQASDGDVWSEQDAMECKKLMTDSLNDLQYAAYIEINADEEPSDLWVQYKLINDPRFAHRRIYELTEIWPVFKNLFKKKAKS